jgi:hypothetical protein
VYIDESGTDLTITVQGEQYEAEATVDVNSDGVDDTALVQTDRAAIEFTDTDADGQADLMTQLDGVGDIAGQATFDAATGEWVHVEHPQDPSHSMHTGSSAEGTVIPADPPQDATSRTITADLPGRDTDLGAPTHDTDDDGANDSVVVTDANGDTVIFTDADEDGDTDFATEITAAGAVTVSEHTGDGQWTVIERGHLDDHGHYQPDDAPEVHIDPHTGTWTQG